MVKTLKGRYLNDVCKNFRLLDVEDEEDKHLNKGGISMHIGY